MYCFLHASNRGISAGCSRRWAGWWRRGTAMKSVAWRAALARSRFGTTAALCVTARLDRVGRSACRAKSFPVPVRLRPRAIAVAATLAKTRPCLCCGKGTPSKIMFACWEHWNILSPQLQSLIIKAFGRGVLKVYRECAVEAIWIWKEAGEWQANTDRRKAARGKDALRSRPMARRARCAATEG